MSAAPSTTAHPPGEPLPGEPLPGEPLPDEMLPDEMLPGDPLLVLQMGSRIGRDTAVYAAGNTAVLIVGLVTLAVFTHYMAPAEYGELSILMFASGSLTILLNLVPMAGILRWVWVSGEADSGAVDDPSRQAVGGTKRRALGTGCWLSLLCTGAGSAALIPFATPLSRLLVGSPAGRADVLLAIASGAAGSFFRLTTNVVRMERRAVAFSMLVALRPAVLLGVSVPLVVSGHGIAGALDGTIAGSLAASVVAVWVVRGIYSIGFSWTDVRGIIDLGSKYTLVISGLWVVHNGDSFVLSRFANHSAVGVYRVASRLGAVLSYLVASFLQAWSPLERGPLFQSTYAAHGLQRMHTKMITYFILCALTVLLGLSLSGPVIVRLAPHSYDGAAGLIPFTSFLFVVYGMFVLIARTTHHRHRDFVHQSASALAAVVFVGLAPLLVPRWGGYGLAVGGSIAMAVACMCFRAIDRTATHFALLEWPRLIGAMLATIACLAVGTSPHVGVVDRVALDFAVFFLVYPALLLATGVVPFADAKLLVSLARGTLVQCVAPLRRRANGAHTAAALQVLDGDEVSILYGLIADRVPVAKLASTLGLPASAVEATAAQALRRLSGRVGVERDDAAIGRWLFESSSSAERDAIMYDLTKHGVDIGTLNAIDSARAALADMPRDVWPAGSPGDRLLATAGAH